MTCMYSIQLLSTYMYSSGLGLTAGNAPSNIDY